MTSRSEPVLSAGQEDAFATLLGRGASLPGDCVWSGASIERTFVRSTYTCGAEQFTLILRHPTMSDGGALTAQFALEGELPASLRVALLERISKNEATVRWATLAPAPDVQPVEPKPELPLAPAALITVTVFVAMLVALSARFVMQRTHTRRRLDGLSPPLRFVGAVVLASLATVLIRSATLAAANGQSIAAATKVLFATLFFALAPLMSPRRGALVTFAGIVITTVVAFVRDAPTEELKWFGHASTLSQSVVPFPLNSHGFRGKEWSLQKPAGVIRIAMVGDSFVEGDGLERERDTLSEQLQLELERRNPGRVFEVINLGIGGNNLASHLDVATEAIRSLSLDALVLCLTLNNDLSPYDGQRLRAEARKLSAFSVAHFFLGETATKLYFRLGNAGRVLTNEQRAYTVAQTQRLLMLRSQWSLPFVVFSFHSPDFEVAALFRENADTTLLTPSTTDDEDFIPGDGHPNARGTSRFAADIARALPWIGPTP